MSKERVLVICTREQEWTNVGHPVPDNSTILACDKCGVNVVAAPDSVKKKEAGATVLCGPCGLEAAILQADNAVWPQFGQVAPSADVSQMRAQRLSTASGRIYDSIWREAQSLEDDGFGNDEITEAIKAVALSLVDAYKVLSIGVRVEDMPSDLAEDFQRWKDTLRNSPDKLPPVSDEVVSKLAKWLEELEEQDGEQE